MHAYEHTFFFLNTFVVSILLSVSERPLIEHNVKILWISFAYCLHWRLSQAPATLSAYLNCKGSRPRYRREFDFFLKPPGERQ